MFFFLPAVQPADLLTKGCVEKQPCLWRLANTQSFSRVLPRKENGLWTLRWVWIFSFYENDATANRYKTRKWSHWLVQPEVRYWTCETFNGLFWGIHTHGGQMNVAGINIPFIIQNHSREMKGHRYEGYFTVVVSVQAIIGYCPADSVWRHLWEWAMHVLNMTNSDVLLAGKR